MDKQDDTGVLEKTALITGGTTGIERATAALLHRASARVAITGQNPDTLVAARRELPADIAVLAADARSLADAARLAHALRTKSRSWLASSTFYFSTRASRSSHLSKPSASPSTMST